MTTPILEMRNIVKIYPNGVMANKGVNFKVMPGEIHALLGENGAGKTTLMNILFGLQSPTSGEIYYKGKKVKITSPHDAIKLGIGMVHQHFMLVPSLTAAENIVLGMEPKKGLFFSKEDAYRITEEIGEKYGLEVPPKERVQDLPVGIRQRIEILKTLLRGAELLVLDEPTAVLTPQETEELFEALKKLVSQGKTIIFITHKLREVKEIGDRITVLRNGKNAGEALVKDVTEEDMSRMMVGRDVELIVQKSPAKPGEVILDVRDIEYTPPGHNKLLKGISFSVREGEILGIAGVEGNGQRELIEILTGLREGDNGSVKVRGKELFNATPRKIRLSSVAHIPEDRMVRGVAALASIEENLVVDRYFMPPFARGKLSIDVKKIHENGEKLVKEFGIKAKDARVPVEMLSGGNIQKVVVAREFSSNAKLIIANQPTRGIDVGATEFIRNRLIEERDRGAAVLLVSADLVEVMQLSDRLIVMYEGEIVGYFETLEGITEQELGRYMLGIKKDAPEKIKEAVVS